MTGCTHLGIPAPQSIRVEILAVGIEPASPQRRVTSYTISLGVAGDARFQVLPRRWAVTQDEGLFGVMIPHAQATFRHESGTGMASRAVLGGIVAVAAGRLSGVRRRRMTREKPVAVIARRSGSHTRNVTIETVRPHVASCTRLRSGCSFDCVLFKEEVSVIEGRLSLDDGPYSPLGTPLIHRAYHSRRGQVTFQATFLRVTGTAFCGFARGGRTMAREEA